MVMQDPALPADDEMPQRPGLAARLVLALVGAYRVLLAPLVGGSCRFTPTCSVYMSDAVRQHGASRGGWLGLRRLARCHPFGSHGFDPVPGSITSGIVSHALRDDHTRGDAQHAGHSGVKVR